MTTPPTPIPIAVKDGEPWQLYAWYQAGKDTEDLLLMRPNGTDAHPIATDLPGEHTAPSWSSDGQRIAFVVRDDTTPERVDLDRRRRRHRCEPPLRRGR